MKLILFILFSIISSVSYAAELKIESTLLSITAAESTASQVSVLIYNAETPKASLRFESSKSGSKLYIWSRDVNKFKEILQSVIADSSQLSSLRAIISFGTKDGFISAVASGASPEVKLLSIATPQGAFSFELAQLPEIVRLLDVLMEHTAEKPEPNKRH
jgi:hypothetical protein